MSKGEYGPFGSLHSGITHMIAKDFSFGSTNIRYAVYGNDPKILIFGGAHPELDVITATRRGVIDQLQRNGHGETSSFALNLLLHPESVLSASERLPNDGPNFNRVYDENYENPPAFVAANLNFLEQFPNLELIVGFHEDWERSQGYGREDDQDGMYVYDYYDGPSPEVGPHTLKPMFDEIRQEGVGLYNGSDDPLDPDLNNQISHGYLHLQASIRDRSYETRALRHIMRRNNGNGRPNPRAYIIEIPTHLDKDLKDRTVAITLKHLVFTAY